MPGLEEGNQKEGKEFNLQKTTLRKKMELKRSLNARNPKRN